jgi:hypothetical protein
MYLTLCRQIKKATAIKAAAFVLLFLAGIVNSPPLDGQNTLFGHPELVSGSYEMPKRACPKEILN